jgi:hypothetical protein
MKENKIATIRALALIALLTLASIFMNSCTSQRRCLAKFPPDTITTVEYNRVIEYRDTTISLEIPGDSVFLYDTITVNENVVNFDPVTAYVPFAWARAWVDENKIKLSLIQYDTIFTEKIDSVIVYTSDTITVKEKVLVPFSGETKEQKRNRLLIWAGLILFTALALIRK